ncbi:pyrimidine 5-nucleotidase [Amylostereum chailletii]|nr:pyrimidine 5-nucleotidase [Amylostereum chailletii]
MSAEQVQDDRLIVFFDIDNTLYSASSNISHAMGTRIHAYFLSLGIPDEEATELHHKYYTEYGLALRGLARHHNVDPLDFDRKCDGSLPLEEMIKPDPALRQLFLDIDRTKCRVWGLTNAYRTHAERVLKILQLDDLVDGLIFCDYSEPNFTCKPEPDYYIKAMRTVGVSDPSRILFIDDSAKNIVGARAVGWARCVHFVEWGMQAVEGGRVKEIGSDTKTLDVVGTANAEAAEAMSADTPVVSDLQQLRTVWADIFK